MKPYRVRVQSMEEIKIMLRGVNLVEAREFKYLGATLCEHWGMEGKIGERAVEGRQVIRILERVMNEENVSNEAKRSIRNSIILPTLTYASEILTK